MLRSAKYNFGWSILLAIALAILAIPSQSGAQSIWGNISIEKGAKVWIEGSAGFVNYQCNAEELSGRGEIENTENPQSTVQGHGDVHISVALPVKSLKCGKRAMNKDMYEALKSDSFPTIRYRLLNAQLDEENDSTSSWMLIRTRGIMEIAGVQDTITMIVRGKMLSNSRFKVKGSKPLNMDTYNIEPPSAMFGLIKADKELSVHFDVTVRLEYQSR
jgi:hypothetical protein